MLTNQAAVLVAPVRKVRERHIREPFARGVAKYWWRRLRAGSGGLPDERRVVRVDHRLQVWDLHIQIYNLSA